MRTKKKKHMPANYTICVEQTSKSCINFENGITMSFCMAFASAKECTQWLIEARAGDRIKIVHKMFTIAFTYG